MTHINKNIVQTPYFSMTKKKLTLKYLHIFSSKCFALKDNYEFVGKFDSKAYEVVFLRYSLERTTYIVFVFEQIKVIKRTYITFNDHVIHGTDSKEHELLKLKN